MKNFDSRVYSVSDFLEWRDSSLLNLSPDFQRRAVWSVKAKSYLIDTILRAKPIPKIILSQELQRSRNVRVVVDGQQRLRAILEFIDGNFRISRAHNRELARSTFDDLEPEIQQDFLKYELGVDLLFDPAYEELLDIFARINTYTITLKKQERLNAQYVGYFKQSAFRIGFRYVNYWLNGRVLTKAQVTRMAEAELASDLLVALIGGVQSNKAIENFYKRFDDTEANLEEIEERFDEVMSYVGAIYPDQELGNTNWRRPVLFYTLFAALAHLKFNLKNCDPNLRYKLGPDHVGMLRVKLDEISALWEEVGMDFEQESYTKELREFVRNSRRATTDSGARISRIDYLAGRIKEHFEE